MKTIFGTLALAYCASLAAAPQAPYEQENWATPESEIDSLVAAQLAIQNQGLAHPASDAVFLRRVSLDLTGTLPSLAQIEAFLDDPAPDKRARRIDALLDSGSYVEFATLRWCDLLRVKSEYPVNLWPNAVQAYHRWVWSAVRENRPYDQFARELLVSSGSNFRVPQVNFYRVAPSQAPTDLAAVVSFTLLGTPLQSLPASDATALATFYAHLGFKKTQEWKEEIVFWNPPPDGSCTYELPDGSSLTLPLSTDPRSTLASWITDPENDRFAEALVNRVWYWLNGYGLYSNPDDLSSDPLAPELTAYLAQSFVASGYDVKQLYRTILNTRVYQQSCLPRRPASSPFASYQLRQLEAEVLADALQRIAGIRDAYTSPIPEPFTFIPQNVRSISLADGSITSPFLETFGRPSRDSGQLAERDVELTAAQRLYLLNAAEIHDGLKPGKLAALWEGNRASMRRNVELTYLNILSRPPTPQEMDTALKNQTSGVRNPRRQLAELVWALLNTKEFLFKH